MMVFVLEASSSNGHRMVIADVAQVMVLHFQHKAFIFTNLEPVLMLIGKDHIAHPIPTDKIS